VLRHDPNGMKASILLVDDQPANLLALDAILAGPDHELISVRSGREALAELESKDFAVVLLDVQMPTMDGFETALQINQLTGEQGRRVPIIFVTGVDVDGSRISRAYAGGAVDFIQKPFEPEIIRSKVSVFVDLFRAKQRVVTEQVEAQLRLQSLAELAVGLMQAHTPDQVAKVVVDQGLRAARADVCTLHLLDECGTSLELIGHRGAAPEVIEKIGRLTDTAANAGTFGALKAGTPTWAESEVDYRAIFPDLASTRAHAKRARAFWSMPLIAEGRPVGLLGMGFYEPRRFGAVDRSFAETFAQQCAQALLRALRRNREDAARGLLATTLRSIGDAVITTDFEGRVTFMNPVAEGLTGWSEGDARGRPLHDVFCDLCEQPGIAVDSPVSMVLRTGAVAGLEGHAVLRSKQGAEIPIDESAAPIRNEDGDLLGVVLVFRDVSREKAQRARREFLAKSGEVLVSSLDFRATLETVARLAVPDVADWCAVDLLEPGASAPRQLALAHADPHKVQVARELGRRYPPDPNAQVGVPQVIRTGRSEIYPEITAARLEAGARDSEHLRLLRELRIHSAMVVPLRGCSRVLGAITFVYADSGRRYAESDLAFAEDFAHRAAMAIENAQALTDLEAAVQAREDLLAIVSHDLRNPLSTVLMGAKHIERLADDSESGARTKKAASTIVGAVDRMSRLVGDLLDLAKLEAGQPLSIDLERHDVSELVRKAADFHEPLASSRQLALGTDLAAPAYAMCDGDRIQQVLANLIGNAIKFTPPRGTIRVGATAGEGEVVVSVVDTGTGIAGDQVPHIFEPYWKADAHRKRGAGLGLSIVKAIVDAHGGRIWVETAKGRGSTFYFTLPGDRAMSATNGAR
jgi:PAS domain S-box-containing protein